MKNIAIVMGGYSSEYHISVKSGQVVYETLDRTKFLPYRILISKEKWVYINEKSEEIEVNKGDFTIVLNGETVKFDAVFNAIHGTPGEDGLLQAYFELLGIPQNSCNYYQAALTFNKRDLLAVLKPYGFKMAASVYLNKGEEVSAERIAEKLGMPFFVKPNKSGSSFGISKVKTLNEFTPALEKAFAEDHEIIIESFLDGIEVSVGVLEFNGKVIALPITEIVSQNDFFDYEAKYEGKSQEITPARIPEDVAEKVRAYATKAYQILGMKGFSRSEFIIVDGEPFMLEMNTIPGLTKESLIPQQAGVAGISLQDLFTNSIEACLL